MCAQSIADTPPEIPGFVLQTEIGRGSSGRVYRARQLALDRLVAIKVIPAPIEAGLDRTLRLFEEAKLLGALDHPGIVRAIDAGHGDGFAWFAMEYVEGRDLGAILGDLRGPLPPLEVVRVGRQLLGALHHAHSRGVVHRDVKPGNILIERGGRVRLLDLGLALRTSAERRDATGKSVGTPQYMAPEQARTADRADARSDVFAVGATLYHALTGSPPFAGQTLAEVLTRLLYETPPPPSTVLAKTLPAGLDQVLLRALEKHPARRFRDAAHFLLALEAIGDGTVSGSRRVRIVAGAAVAILVALGGAWWWFAGRAPRDSQEGARSGGISATVPSESGPTDELLRVRQALLVLDSRCDQDGLLAALEVVRSVRTLVRPTEREEVDTAVRALEDGVRSGLKRDAEDLIARANAALDDHQPLRLRKVEEELERFLRRTPGDVDPGPSLRAQVDSDRSALARRRVLVSSSLREEWLASLRAATEFVGGPPVDAESGGRLLLAAVAAPATELDLLEPTDRRQVILASELAAARLLEAPQRRARGLVEAVESALEAGRLGDAASALATLEAGGPSVSGETLRRVLARAIAEEREATSTLLDHLERGPADRLSTEDRVQRREALTARRVDAERRGLGALAELEPSRALLAAVTSAVEEVAVGDQALLEAFTGRVEPFDFTLRRVGGVGGGRYRFQGVSDGGVVLCRVSDGFATTVRPEVFASDTVRDVLGELATAPSPLASTLRAHWDGDDELARSLARAVTDEAVSAWILELLNRADAKTFGRFPSEAERRAALTLRQAQLALEGGRCVEAGRQFTDLLARGRAGTGPAFWSRHRGDVERGLARAEALAKLERALEPLLRFRTLTDPEAKLIRFEPRMDDPELVTFLRSPPGVQRTAEGWMLTESLVGAPWAAPSELMGLGASIPDGPWKRFTVRALVTTAKPVEQVVVTGFGASFLGVTTLKDGTRYRNRPLHGLERQLWAPRSVRRSSFVSGTIVAAQHALIEGTAAFDGFPAGVSTTIELSATRTETGLQVTVTVGEHSRTLTRPEAALDPWFLALAPDWHLRSLVLEAGLP